MVNLSEQYRRQHGADMRRGKHLRRLLREAGFRETGASASYDYHGTAESVRAWVQNFITSMQDLPAHPLVRAGLTEEPTLSQIAAALQRWQDDPDAFLARPFCEAIGRAK